MKGKIKYFSLELEHGQKTFPIEWDKLPDDVVEKCESKAIHDIKTYSIKDEKIKTTSVIFFLELSSEEVENIKDRESVEDTKNNIIYII